MPRKKHESIAESLVAIFGGGKKDARSTAVAVVPPQQTAKRMYATARNDRLTGGWMPHTTSADSELVSSLTNLRNRSRALVRDAAYARRARQIVVNNVIGSGIGMQCQVKTTRGDLNKSVNDAIENAFTQWSEPQNCHTGGKLAFGDLERAMMGEIFEAGETIVREHYAPFGSSLVPYAMELVEAERLADEFQAPALRTAGAFYRMGVEVDRFHRPLAYWLREMHPGDVSFRSVGQSDRMERVDASLVNHMYVVNRWPQTRGVPWLHATARRLNDMDGYSEAEIVAARGAASYMGIIETENPDPTSDPLGERQEDGTFEFELTPGLVPRLRAGEKFEPFIPNRPNSQIDPFMRLMLREVAAGTDVSYESISRDYSQSNYSSSRLALLDDRDVWKTLQLWFIRTFRQRCHRRWLQQAILAGAIPGVSVDAYAASPLRYEAVRFKPRGWSWIDPEKEVNARKEAVRSGFDTITNVIAETANGRDVEDVFEERAEELRMAAELGLKLTTNIMDEAEAKAESVPEPAQPAVAVPPGAPASTEDQSAALATIAADVRALLNEAERVPSRNITQLPPRIELHVPEQQPIRQEPAEVEETFEIERDEDMEITRLVKTRRKLKR